MGKCRDFTNNGRVKHGTHLAAKGPYIATQLNSIQLDVELSTRSQREQLTVTDQF